MKVAIAALAVSLSLAASSVAALNAMPIFPDMVFPEVQADTSTQGSAAPLLPSQEK
ncbi:MAG: hypothetical protein AAGA47_08735 [Pseudomonadota bacterium]